MIKKIYHTDFFMGKDRNSNVALVDKHIHNLFEIYYMQNGECDYFIDGKIYNVTQGDIVLIPAGILHKTSYRSDVHSRIIVNCSSKFIPAAVIAYLKNNMTLYRNNKAEIQIKKILDTVYGEYKNPDEFSEEIITDYIRLLFFTIARNTNNYKSEKTINEYTKKAKEYIENNYMTDITLKETANILKISPEHLSRVFKAETGFGFCEYINLIRLNKANELLKDKKMSVLETAYKCGFNDSNYFSVKFKKLYGISPLAYKNNK